MNMLRTVLFKYSLIKLLALFLISSFLSGCATTYLDGKITTSVDSSFNPTTNMRVVVAPQDFDSIYYLPTLKEALEVRGFRNITVSRSNNVPLNSFDLKVVLKVGRQLTETTKVVDDYGIVGTKVTPGDFKCKTTNNELLGRRTRCRSGETKTENIYGSTGTKEVTDTTLDRSISLTFITGSNNQTVLTAIGSSQESDYKCSNLGIFTFLIIHTTKYLSFNTPINSDYLIEIPEGYSCETVDDYDRSLRGGISTSQVTSNTKTNEPQTKTDGSRLPGYVGEWKYAQRHGQGTLTYDSGTKYVGEWKKHWQHGQGTMTFVDGRMYVGQWKDGKMSGQGTLVFADDTKYVGEWEDNNHNGHGTKTFSNGRMYVGQFKDGGVNGQGTFTDPNGGKYVGEWKDGKYDGQGTLTYKDGREFVGQFKDGVWIK